MRCCRRRLCILSLLLTALVVPFTRAEEFKLEEGFKLLFNGKNLDG